MRVAIFFDGKNFYSGFRARAGSRRIESFTGLADWLVQRARGTYLSGAYYYTGIETGGAESAERDNAERLKGFLDMLDMQSGFFVFRFPRKVRQSTCPSCGSAVKYTTEKEVDTTLVADMLRLAAVDAFDVAVVVSGDADLAPGVEGVRGLGKQVYVATWGGSGLADRVRKAAFDHIDLLDGLESFGATMLPAESAGLELETGKGVDEAFVAEVRAAQDRFTGGYVGVNYFLTRWRSDRMSSEAAVRQRILNRLIESGRIEIYESPNGERAMRLPEAVGEPSDSTVRAAQPGVQTPDFAPGMAHVANEEVPAVIAEDAGKEPELSFARGTSTVIEEGAITACFDALRAAERQFAPHGYVGRSYFLRSWRSPDLPDDPGERERLVAELEARGLVETYQQGSGAPALRTVSS